MKILSAILFTATFMITIHAEYKVYEFESDGAGFNTKTYFYDNGFEVVAIGGQFTPQIAEQAVKFVQGKTSNPISYLVITHPNPDKFNGASYFQKMGAKVISSYNTAIAIPEVHQYKKYYFVEIAKMFTNKTYPQMATVDILFENKMQIHLANNDTFLLKELPLPGVSSTQTIAIFPKANITMVGDLIHHKAHAWLEGGIVNGKAKATILPWIQNLEILQQQLTKYPQMTIYGGRGEAANADSAINEQINYLKMANKIVQQYIKNLGTKKAELTGEKAKEHHLAIEKIFVETFPEYKLNYMIRFGIYGLINSNLEN